MTWKDLPAGQITYRQIKGEPLTYEEADINFGWLKALIEALISGGIITISQSDENNDSVSTLGEMQVKVNLESLEIAATELIENYLQGHASWMDNLTPQTKMVEVIENYFRYHPENVTSWFSSWIDSADGESIMSGLAEHWVNDLGGKNVIQSVIEAAPPVAKVISLSSSDDTDAIFAYDVDNGKYVTEDGTMFFDSDTYKTLTFFTGVLLDSMGNVVAGQSV